MHAHSHTTICTLKHTHTHTLLVFFTTAVHQDGVDHGGLLSMLPPHLALLRGLRQLLRLLRGMHVYVYLITQI